MTSLVFFGSSEYSVIVLQELINHFSVVLVITKIDKPFGRKQEITPNPVAKFAKDNNLPLYQSDIINDEFKQKIINSKAQAGLCVAFGPPFFDNDTINLFPAKIANIHPSPLPRYRGATPAPWQIINGETKSAVTFFQIDALPDHGPIIHQLQFLIDSNETSDSFYKKAFTLAANNLGTILNQYLTKPDKLEPQNHLVKSYYPKLTKEMGKIDWNWQTPKIIRFINAMDPWPIAWTNISDKQGNKLTMKVFSAVNNNEKVELQKVQIEGKKPTFWSEISQHYSLE